MQTLKAAILGCGKIADDHAAQIRRVGGAKLVAACDREGLMADQLCERFHIPGSFSDVQQMLEKARPDVVHITTSAESHYPLARQCLEAGCHLYVEKPFTLYTREAEELIALAYRRRLRITVGHDDQFRHVARRMRELVRTGYLGGPPVHMESYYCYEITETGYAKALLSDPNHWVRRLPGRLLHNIISHGIARIAEFLSTNDPEIVAHGSVSPVLRKLGEEDIVDELRVILSEGGTTTAYFTFSSQMRPVLHQFRLYGPRNGLLLDQDNETLIRLRGAKLKSYSEHFLAPLIYARQYWGNALGNAGRFLARDFQMKAGMKFLIESFYRSISKEGPVPIPYPEILRTSRIMDEIFRQLENSRRETVSREPVRREVLSSSV
jgi:predicted dehydrogenase